jgi:hypothetical protein
MRELNTKRGWAFLELLLGGFIVIVLIGVALYYFSRSGIQAVTSASFTTAPATVSQIPATGTFVYSVTRKIGSAAPAGLPSRATTFAVFPSAGVHIMDLNGIAVGGITGAASGAASTDAAGQITVILKIDYLGNARLVATDTTTGRTEEAAFVGVP